MKILYLHQYFKKPSMSGGIRSYEFAKRLVNDGHEVAIITSDTENKFSGWRVESVQGIKVHWISIKYNNTFGFLRRLWAFFKFLMLSTYRILNIESDKLIATSTPLTVAIPAIVYKKITGKPFFFEVRDVWPEVPIALGVLNNKLLKYIAVKLERSVYKNADVIIALSSGMKKSIVQRANNTPVIVIPNAADTLLFRLPGNYETNLLYEGLISVKNKHSKVVFYTGTLGLVNNLRYFIKLSSFSKGDVGFVIVGSGKEKQDLEVLAKEVGVLNKTLYFFDEVPKESLCIVHHLFDLATSTVLPIPALYANSANKIFDAFASGTPIMINHGGWISNLIDENQCGVVLNEIASHAEYDKLSSFLYNSTVYKLASESSLALGANDYNREELYLKFKNVVEGL